MIKVNKLTPCANKVFIYLSIIAKIKDHDGIKAGQCRTSYKELIENTSWKEGYIVKKFTKNQIQKALGMLIKEGIITNDSANTTKNTTENTTKNTKGLVLSVIFPDKYKGNNAHEEYNEEYNKEYNGEYKTANSIHYNKNKENKENKDKRESQPPLLESNELLSLKKEFPRIFKMEVPLDDVQLQKLYSKFTKEEVIDIFMAMENYKPLITKKTKAYLTALSWLNKDKKEKSKNANNNGTKKTNGNVKNESVRATIENYLRGGEPPVDKFTDFEIVN